MRFATFEYNSHQDYGLVLCNPLDDRDWVYAPDRIEQMVDERMSIKGAFSPWTRPSFIENNAWPETLVSLLALGVPGMDAARRMDDFIRRFAEQGDPLLLKQAGHPVDGVQLCPPVPQPGLVLGVVGNSAGFLRMDPSRGRNLYHPHCHQRTQTSLIGHGEPIVVPAASDWIAGTTELGIIIGAPGREIRREDAMRHVAGYVVVNDCAHQGYYNLWRQTLNTVAAPHFHASNVASWLGKKSDTMCPVGPYLVTPDEVGDPYDLMCYYRENGVLRNRAHTGALATGIEEVIYWLSQFMTLQPGMLIHFGAAGRDGVMVDHAAMPGPDYCIEIEIENVGTLRNPVVELSKNDWRAPEDVSRRIHPSPSVRKLLSERREIIRQPEDWRLKQTKHFWPLLANSEPGARRTNIEPRPNPLTYNTPVSALAPSGTEVMLPPRARRLTVTCEMALVIQSVTKAISAEQADHHILGYVVLAALHDSSFADYLIAPHILHAKMAQIYPRWPEHFNVVSRSPVPLETIEGREMTLEIDGIGQMTGSTDAYLLNGSTVIEELSTYITLLPGDVISLGETEATLTIPVDYHLPAGTQLRAAVNGLDPVVALLNDQRRSSNGGDSRPYYS